MPDLNLLDEGGMEEEAAPSPAPSKARSGGGGGAMKWVIIIVLAVVVLGGGGYFAKSKGMWPFKKKAPVVTEVPEDQYPAEGQQQPTDAQLTAADTSQVALLETPAVEEKKEAPKEPAKEDKKEAAPKEPAEEPAGMTGTKLSEMTGNYTVQVVSYHLKKDASDTRGNLELAGYPAYVERIAVKDGERFTVRIGKYESVKAAESAVKSYGAQLRASYTIEKVKKK